MKKICILLLTILVISGCTTRHASTKGSALMNTAKMRSVVAAERAALKFFKRGGFQKSAELFKEVADIYSEVGLKARERCSLVAAAKSQLWAGDRPEFLETMVRVRGLIGEYEYPKEDDILTLINISDRMEGRSLSFTPVRGHEEIFSNKTMEVR